MNVQIKNRWTGEVIHEGRADETLARLVARLCTEARERGTRADLRGADLRGANLRGADLRYADLRYANLRYADLREADLREADLRGANLSRADLSRAVLSDADLRYADLSYANWLPKIQNIHSAVYAAAAQPNALNMSEWHTCDTTHCRAGWVIHLAGAAGRALEGVYSTPTAAALIYQASDPALERIPDFYCDNETALADMKRLAKLEAAR